MDGLFNRASVGLGIHPPHTGSLLSGAQVSNGAILHSGLRVDQMIANTIGQDTAHSSIVLACEQPMTGYHETNYSMAYSSHISWQSPESPVPVELYPSLALDNLFARCFADHLARSFGDVYTVPGVNQWRHGLSHNNNSDAYESIARWHVSQFA